MDSTTIKQFVKHEKNFTSTKCIWDMNLILPNDFPRRINNYWNFWNSFLQKLIGFEDKLIIGDKVKVLLGYIPN